MVADNGLSVGSTTDLEKMIQVWNLNQAKLSSDHCHEVSAEQLEILEF